MGALPKRKISKGRKNRRRSQDAIKKMNLVPCPSCGTKKRSHQACPNCGKYGDREVLKIE